MIRTHSMNQSEQTNRYQLMRRKETQTQTTGVLWGVRGNIWLGMLPLPHIESQQQQKLPRQLCRGVHCDQILNVETKR